MKVCLISTSLYSLERQTGAEVYVQRQAKELMRQGHEVVIITTHPIRSRKIDIKQIDGARVYSFYPLNIYDRSSVQKKPLVIRLIWHIFDALKNPHPYAVIKKILMAEKPDVAHIHCDRGLSASLCGAVKDAGVPLVYKLINFTPLCPKGTLVRRSGEMCRRPRLACRIYRMAKKSGIDGKPDIVTADCQVVIDKFREHGFWKNTRVVKIPLAIDLDGGKVDKDYDVIDVLFVGHLVRTKGAHILLDAFQQLKQKNVRLHIVGDGPESKDLRQMGSNDTRIQFHGFLTGEALEKMYQKANVAVVPSVWNEPFGITIIESLKYGTPVIGSNIGGIPETIEHGYNGLLFEAGNVTELKGILENLIENPEALKRLSEGAFKSSGKYDIKQHIHKLEEIYIEISNKGTSG